MDEDRDEQLLAELSALFRRAEPVPESVVETAKAGFVMHSLDADLALLTWDSAVDPSAAAMRAGESPTEPHALTFECGDIAVEVEVTAPARGWRLMGQLTPTQIVRLELHHAPHAGAGQAGEVSVGTVEVDDLGRFTVTDLTPGLVRLVLHRPDASSVATEWFRVD